MTTSYTVPDGPKMLRETLCVAQHAINQSHDQRKREHIARLGRLVNECDRHRPLGVDGKHNDRHTSTCGCEDVPPSALIAAEREQDYPGRGERRCTNIACPLRYAHHGPCAPPGERQLIGAELLLHLADEAQHMADQGVETLLNTTLAQMLRRRARVMVTPSPVRPHPFGVM
jgi:hypothetical protein